MNQPGNEKHDDLADEDLELDLELDDLELDLGEDIGEDLGDDSGSSTGRATGGQAAAPAPADFDLAKDGDGSACADAAAFETAAATTVAGLTGLPASEPVGDTTPSAETVAEPAAAAPIGADPVAATGSRDGQWVWQFGAPPPPPSFSAVFFSGTALKEKYRFFACGVLAVLGCLLPWQAGVPGVEGSVPGFMVPIGAVCMALSLWLVWAACTSIYARKPMILPAFLMLIPAEVTWVRLLDAWGAADTSLGMTDQINQVLYTMGTGVLLTLVGSTLVALQFVLTLGKVLGSKKEPAGGRTPKAKKEKAAKPAKAEKAKPEKPAKADKASGAEAPKAGKAVKERRGRKR